MSQFIWSYREVVEDQNSSFPIAHMFREQCYRYWDMEGAFPPTSLQSFIILADAKSWLIRRVCGIGAMRITPQVTSLLYGSFCHPVGEPWQKQFRNYCSWDILINIGQIVYFRSPGKNMEKLCLIRGVLNWCFSNIKRRILVLYSQAEFKTVFSNKLSGDRMLLVQGPHWIARAYEVRFAVGLFGYWSWKMKAQACHGRRQVVGPVNRRGNKEKTLAQRERIKDGRLR